MECQYRDCQRDARAGWTTCNRHYSTGRTRPKRRCGADKAKRGKRHPPNRKSDTP